jgi:methionine synthase I (cobalamin-dependent)
MAGNALIEELMSKGVVLTDGAWGTELQARGLPVGTLPDTWNVEHPERVEEVPRAYVEAGSQLVLTNTFQANRLTLAAYPNAPGVAEINRAGVEISKRAAAGQAKVFASMGPSGKFLRMKNVTEEELSDAFSEQAQALAEAGADAIVIETMMDLAEIKLALAAAKATGLPVVACMVYDAGKNKDRTMMGVSCEQAARELADAGADVIGANCGIGIEAYVPICAALSSATDLPIWIKANAGLPVIEGGQAVYRTTPEEFAGHLAPILDAGASFIGGCCGTDPAVITALRDALGR